MQSLEQPQGSGTRRRGNELGFRFFIVSIRLFGLRGAYGLLYIVCLYYALLDRPLFASAVPYISRRFPRCGLFRKHLHVYRLLVSQGKQLIDRYSAVVGHSVFDIPLKGREKFLSLIRDSEKGAILLTFHQGNWQVAMTALSKMEKTVHLLMIPDANPAFHEKMFPDREAQNLRIISPRQYLGGVVEIMNALRKGHVVSMMGDRSYDAKTIEASFLGDKAWFPYSSFSLAAAAECPLIVLNITKVSAYSYAVDMSNVLYPRYEGRRSRVSQLQPFVQEAVNMMESFVEQHPYQCFLFRDVWMDPHDGSSA
jgi:predicted LPLAT superfamily acyltransferase